MDDSLYDEFGNYIGPEIESDQDSDREDSDDREDHGNEDDGATSDGEGPSNGWMTTTDATDTDMIDNQVVLAEDKKYYPTAEEVYGEDVETLVMDEDEQTLEMPIIKPVKNKKFEVGVKDSSTYVSSQFLLGLMSNPTLSRNVALVGHLQHGMTVFTDKGGDPEKGLRSTTVSKLIFTAPHEAENQIEVSLRQAFESLEPSLRPPFSLTIPKSDEYTQLNRAILHGILVEPHFAKTHITHLHALVTDGYATFVNILLEIVHHLYPKLLGSVKNQLLWVTDEMVRVLAIGYDALLVSLLRQIVGGDFSDNNLWLCTKLVTLFLDKWECFLEEAPHVLCSALYVFLRVLADHCRLNVDKLKSLKRSEIHLCVKIVREEFHLCLKIGRDFIRLLQDLVHVPEFKAIWKDLILNPSTLGFGGVPQIYSTRTSPRYALLRINFEMETQLKFLLNHVKLGHQQRHFMWFHMKFLNEPDKETVIVDIVRFICSGHHPSNEIIQSDVVPRWAVIGWLLKSCRKNYVQANVKLALFYDWLFFDERVDNIMNIEPAILLMVRSVPKYVDMTNTLLDFLLLLVDKYDMEHRDIIVKGVSSAFRILVSKGVIQSLDVLTSCPALYPPLKECLGKLLSCVNLQTKGSLPVGQ